MGQLHLDLSILSVSPLGEDVQNQLGPIQDPELGAIGDRRHLPGGKILVEDDQVDPLLHALEPTTPSICLHREVSPGKASEVSG